MDIGEEHKATLRSSRSRVGSIAIPHDHSGTKLTDLIKAGRKRVVLDLKNLVYISSAGFRMLLLVGQLAEAAVHFRAAYSRRDQLTHVPHLICARRVRSI
jgi:hypothetical protein